MILEREQERRGKIEGLMRTEGISPQTTKIVTSDAMTLSVAEEAENASSVSNNRACSDGESGKNECSNGTAPTTRVRV